MAATGDLEVATHEEIDHRLAGVPVALSPGYARVELSTTPEMRVDDQGLVHGGFVFGLADHAAMLAVNHPNVVLGKAEVRFAKPVRVGERLVARAEADDEDGRRREVHVTVEGEDGEAVFSGRFVCQVLLRHVLEEQPEASR